VLTTSRARLRVSAEREYPVAPLTLSAPDATIRDIQEIDAVRLFVERARAVQRDFVLTAENAEAVARICRRLDGLPLAIELAASRANVLSPQLLLDRLEQCLPLLTRGSRDAPRRQQTMADTIAWSYNLLDPDAQWLFRRLTVFVGGFTLDTVEWLVARHPADGVGAIDALATLTDNNLVVRTSDSPDGMRFSMFETIREYGIAQLIERRELRAAHDLLAGYCRSHAIHGDGIPNCIVPEPWVAMVDRERGNIRAAYHHLAADDDREGLFEFATAFGHYLYNRGPADEAWSWFEQALDAPVPRPEVRLQGLYWASHLSSHLGMTETADRLANEALATAEALGDTGWRAAIVHCLAMIRVKCGEAEQAEALFDEELRLWEQAGVQGLSGFALMFLGVFAFEQGDFTKARALEDKADEILAGMGGIGWLASIRWIRGRFSITEGRCAEAAMHFSDSVRIASEQKASMIQHLGLVGLAVVASNIASHEAAGRLIGAADRSLEQTGQHLGGAVKELYDRAAAASRSAIGPAAFAAACKLGAASGPAEWLRDGEAIARAAADRERRDEAGTRTVEPCHRRALRPLAATK
jgi:predicted ATPase